MRRLGETFVKPTTWILLAGVAALGVRLLHRALMLGDDPLLLYPIIDAGGYHRWALQILENPLGDEVFYQSPAYPYSLALIYRLLGPSWESVSIVQAFAGAIGAMLAGRITWRALTNALPAAAPWTGVLAAWLVALFKPLVFYDALLLKVELTVVTLLLVFHLLYLGVDRVRPRWLWLILCGVFLAIAGLFRGNVYFAAPLIGLWLLLGQGAERPLDIRSKRHLVERMLPPLAFAFGFFLVVSAVTVRNSVVADQLVFSNAQSGAVFYEGNNPKSPHGGYVRPSFVRAHPDHEEEDYRREAERRTGRRLTSAEASRFWWKETFGLLRADPRGAARRFWHKLTLVVEAFELGDNYSLGFHDRFSWALDLAFVTWTLVISLAFATLAEPRLLFGRLGPLTLFVLAYTGSLVLFYLRARYRTPMIAALAPLAAIEVAFIRERLKETDTKRLGIHLALVVAMLAASLSLGLPRALVERHGLWWTYLGSLHFRHGDSKRAEELMSRALQEDPRSSMTWLNWGSHLLKSDPTAAASLCKKALELEPTLADARECAAFALLKIGKHREAQQILEPIVVPFMPFERRILAAAVAYSNCDADRVAALLEDEGLTTGQRSHALALLAAFFREDDVRRSVEYLDEARSLVATEQEIEKVEMTAATRYPRRCDDDD